MKALSVDRVPAGRWHLEIKWDGFRAIGVVNAGRAELWSRNRKPMTAAYPEIIDALRRLRCASAVLDGELVALDSEGRARFQLLQARGRSGTRPAVVYYVFDLLQHDGRSLLSEPIEIRQAALAKLVGRGEGAIRVSPVFDVRPEELLAAMREKGLEGIIAKEPGSPYEPDRRSGRWLKCKVFGEQEFVIGGFTPPRNSRTHFGAILVGYFSGDELLYAGKVGSGFDRAGLETLHAEFVRRKAATCPFANLRSGVGRTTTGGVLARSLKGVTWIRPELVAQIRFTEWTDDGLLRHPVFLGLRRDKLAREVVREAGPVET